MPSSTPDASPLTTDFQRPFALAPGATEVVLVRHGAAAFSADAVHDGDVIADPPLTALGRRQAQALAVRLKQDRFDTLFTSTRIRARQTAASLEVDRGIVAQAVEDLAEVHLGAWEGPEFVRRVADNDPLMQRVMAEHRWDVIPGAESMDDVAVRVAAGLQEIVRVTGPDGMAVAVVHAGVIAEACRQVTNSLGLAFLAAENCSLTRLVRLPDGHWFLRSFNETGHLSAEA